MQTLYTRALISVPNPDVWTTVLHMLWSSAKLKLIYFHTPSLFLGGKLDQKFDLCILGIKFIFTIYFFPTWLLQHTSQCIQNCLDTFHAHISKVSGLHWSLTPPEGLKAAMETSISTLQLQHRRRCLEAWNLDPQALLSSLFKYYLGGGQSGFLTRSINNLVCRKFSDKAADLAYCESSHCWSSKWLADSVMVDLQLANGDDSVAGLLVI